MENDDFKVRFMQLPDKRRSEGQHEFTVHLSRFPNMYQAALLTLLDGLKDAGLKLTWTHNSLYEWLEDHAVNTLDDMVISLFTTLETDAFTFSGGYKQALSAIKACVDKSGIRPEYRSAVPNMLHLVVRGASDTCLRWPAYSCTPALIPCSEGKDLTSSDRKKDKHSSHRSTDMRFMRWAVKHNQHTIL